VADLQIRMEILQFQYATPIYAMAFALFIHLQDEKRAIMSTFSSNEISVSWQPIHETVNGMRHEFQQFETMSQHFVSELEQLQAELLAQAVEFETLQLELAREQEAKLRWLSRFEQQEAQLGQALEELAQLRRVCEARETSEVRVATREMSFDEQRTQLELEQLQRDFSHAQAELARVTKENEEMREERGRWTVQLEYQQREYETVAAQRDQMEHLQHLQEQRINEELLSLQQIVQSLVQRSHSDLRERHEPKHHEAGHDSHSHSDSHGDSHSDSHGNGYHGLPGSLQAQFARLKRDHEHRHGQP
jgi:chromosome segregation ATPase